jgi:hypothetical protein
MRGATGTCRAETPRPLPRSARGRTATLTEIPAKMASSMAGTPSLMSGILINKFGRVARADNSLAAARVLAVS